MDELLGTKEYQNYDNGDISDVFSEEDIRQQRKEEIDLFDLMEQNIELSKEILETSKYIKKYVAFRKIMTFIKIFIILVPIVLAIIYIPPLLEKWTEPFQNFISNYQAFIDTYSKIESSGLGLWPGLK